MHDELTAVDMQKMREELREREEVLMPKILEDVKVARSFGDLSIRLPRPSSARI